MVHFPAETPSRNAKQRSWISGGRRLVSTPRDTTTTDRDPVCTWAKVIHHIIIQMLLLQVKQVIQLIKQQLLFHFNYMKNTPLTEFRKTLPTYAVKNELLQSILHGQHQVTIICSATGSGKSTQIPQYIHEENSNFRITVTQPRRVAAISIAQRVSQEQGCKVGRQVGYCVRFDEKESDETRIRYCTDGIAVREALIDQSFKACDVFIVDEAHERSVQTDILLGLLKNALNTNKKLRIVVMSATLDTQFFANYFGTDQILFVQGKMFPVRHFFLGQPENNYLEAISLTVLQINEGKTTGDILVFLPGEREIKLVSNTVQLLNQQQATKIEVLELYANLSQETQMQVFQTDCKSRRCILATNIAETSLTVPNITFVIDSGFVRQKIFDPQTQIQKLLTIPASKSSVNQRCGRAGRVCEGEAYHICSFSAFEQLKQTEVCEILRCDLSSVYLTLIGCGLKKVLEFQFINHPSNWAKKLALAQLLKLNLVQVNEQKEFTLTQLGKQVVSLPLEIPEALSIIKAVNGPVLNDVIAVICILNSVEQFFTSSTEEEQQNRLQFRNYLSDHLMLLQIFKAWSESENRNEFAKRFGVQNRTLEYVLNVQKQVREVVDKLKIEGEKTEDKMEQQKELSQEAKNWQILQCLCYGFRQNTVKVGKDDRSYEKNGVIARIHPSSGVKGGKILLYHQIIQTTDNYMRIVSVLDEKWLQ
ncbi:Pre-mRNA-splicing_factor ATP-dependent RNA helicase [Hexamita inflata]|uniref:Pre-mRNA-splicing_factor ATP-dependent RNA helicase n=1 Tax=Hexamita inflata TaxID=28002 RepID=A0ABP1LT43_9EUKA